MSQQRSIPTQSNYDIVTFDLLSDGRVISPAYQVMQINITHEVNRIPVAQIVLRDGDAAEETFSISESEDFVPGRELVIKVGYDGDNEVLFKGIITKQGVRVSASGNSSLQVEARDAAVRMTLGRHSRYFEQQKDSEVMGDLIGSYGLAHDIAPTSLQHREIVQHHATDWDFVLSRADANGYLILVEAGTIKAAKPDTSQAPVLSLVYGSTIISIEAAMDARDQWQEVDAAAWDYAAQTLFTHTTTRVSVDEPGNLSGKKLSEAVAPNRYALRTSTHALTEELSAWSDAVLQRSRLAKIRGRLQLAQGSALPRPGTLLDLHGMGERFNGKLYISAVRHELVEGSWHTYVQFGLPPDCFAAREHILDHRAAGLLPAVSGLQIGKVVQLQDDPDGEARIQVRLPIIDPAASGIWCRVALLDAGDERSTFFMPEIDDEVIVGFINDDPRDAVVLGQLHSSAKPPPVTVQDTNHIKGIYTREKMRLFFDDEHKTITIDTPAGNSIVIDEASTSITITDQNDNRMTMEPAGITLDSPGDITIKAGGNISIEATANLTAKALKTSVEASSALEVKGATAKVSASGIAEIAGSLVKIN